MFNYPHSRAILAASVAAFAISLGLIFATDSTPLLFWLRGGAGWRWPYEAPTDFVRLTPITIAVIAYLGVGTWWLSTIEDKPYTLQRDGSFLLYCFFGGLILQVAVLSFYGDPFEVLFMRTASELSGGFFQVAVNLQDIPYTLTNYPSLMEPWPAHPKAHPPGMLLMFWGAEQVFNGLPGLAAPLASPLRLMQCHEYQLAALNNAELSAAWVGMLFPVAGLASVFVAYGYMRFIYDRETGMRAALWLPLIPAMLLFSPQPNQSFVLVLVSALWMWHAGLQGKGEDGPSLIWFFLTGLLLSLATFLSFTNLSMLGVLGVYTLVYIVLSARHEWLPEDWSRFAIGVVVFLIGFLSVWLVYYLTSGVSGIEVLRTSLALHFGFTKPYLPWLLFHPLDLMLFSGVVLFTLMLLEALRVGREIYDYYLTPQPALVLPVAAVISFAGLALLGVVRGEVGRLLLGLMPLVLLPAARAVQVRKNTPVDLWLPTVALGFQVIVMVGFLRVIGTELTPAPPTSTEATESENYLAEFGGYAQLTDYDAQLSGSVLDLSLTWHTIERFDQPYYTFALVVDEHNQPVADMNWLPVDTTYLTTCWQAGEYVADRASIPLTDASADEYWVSLALFDFETGDRLPVTLADGSTDSQIGLGPILVD